MAQEKDTSTTETMQKKKKKKTDRAFPVSTLRSECVKLFGCTSSTFDGAFFGKKEKNYTIDEAKKMIAEWLKREVK